MERAQAIPFRDKERVMKPLVPVSIVDEIEEYQRNNADKQALLRVVRAAEAVSQMWIEHKSGWLEEREGALQEALEALPEHLRGE